MDLDHRRGVVTGAGSGIGREMALRLAARGAELVLVGRRRQTLQRTADLMRDAGGTAHVAVADLTEPETPARIARRAQDVLGDYDLLINNPGNVRAGRLREHSAEDIQAMIALNLTAPVLLSRAALPALRPPTPERRDNFAALEQGRHEINTAQSARRALQDLHRRDPLAVDAQPAPRLREMENAVGGHRSI
ncbi:SDR family NAD(P)-dependent oxidoreductase [Streptomyces sp. NPDC054813]